MTVSEVENNTVPTSALGRFLSGASFGLAQTYWGLFILGAIAFFGAGSYFVAERQWTPYVSLLGASIVYSFVLLTGVSKHYRGSDPGKALGRIGMLFLLLNLTNTLLTFSFI